MFRCFPITPSPFQDIPLRSSRFTSSRNFVSTALLIQGSYVDSLVLRHTRTVLESSESQNPYQAREPRRQLESISR